MKNFLTFFFAITLVIILVGQYRLREEINEVNNEIDQSRLRLILLCINNPNSFLPELRQPTQATAEYCRDYINSLPAEAGSK